MDEYRNHASLYDVLVGPFLHSTHRDIVDIVKENGCSSLLDICCGTGLLVGKAVAAGLKPVGTDLSPAMLDIARSNHPGIDFLKNDASDLPMEKGSFDAVTVSFALHEKPRDVAFAIVREALRLVRKGGLVIVADYHLPVYHSSFFTGFVVQCVERIAGKQHYAYFKEYMRPGGTEAFLAEAGLNATCRTTHMNGWSGIFVHVKDA